MRARSEAGVSPVRSWALIGSIAGYDAAKSAVISVSGWVKLRLISLLKALRGET